MPNSPEPWTKVEAENQLRPRGLVRRDIVHSATVLHLLRSGKMAIRTRGQRYTVRPGQWIWLASGVSTSEVFTQQARLLTVRLRIGAWAVQAEADREAVALIRRIDACTDAHGPVLPLSERTRRRLGRHVEGMVEIWNQPGHPHHRCALKAGAMQMLLMLADDPTLGRRLTQTPPEAGRSKAAHKISEALHLLSKRDFVARSDLSVEDLAAACGYGVSRFHSLFVEATGTTPQRYLTERRITLACELLGKPHRTILDVALACGFGSQSRFYAAFKQITGQVPGAYRRQRKD